MRIDDERLELVTITSIDVDNEMNRAIVFFDSLDGEDGDAASSRRSSSTAGGSRRRSTARCGRRRRRPDFRPDEVIRAAERIEEILRSRPRPTSPTDGA